MGASRTLLRSFSATSVFTWCHHTHRLRTDKSQRIRGSANCTKPGAGLELSLCTGEVGVTLVEGPGTSTYGSGEEFQASRDWRKTGKASKQLRGQDDIPDATVRAGLS